MNLKFLHFSSTAACMALHLKKEMVPLVHAESVELLGMIRMVRMYSTFFFLIGEPLFAHMLVLRKELNWSKK